MRLLVLSLLVLAVLVPAALITRRWERSQAKVDRHGLDDLRRIYRRDNPRGGGLDPLIQDHRRVKLDPQPIKPTQEEKGPGVRDGM